MFIDVALASKMWPQDSECWMEEYFSGRYYFSCFLGEEVEAKMPHITGHFSLRKRCDNFNQDHLHESNAFILTEIYKTYNKDRVFWVSVLDNKTQYVHFTAILNMYYDHNSPHVWLVCSPPPPNTCFSDFAPNLAVLLFIMFNSKLAP